MREGDIEKRLFIGMTSNIGRISMRYGDIEKRLFIGMTSNIGRISMGEGDIQERYLFIGMTSSGVGICAL